MTPEQQIIAQVLVVIAQNTPALISAVKSVMDAGDGPVTVERIEEALSRPGSDMTLQEALDARLKAGA